MTGAANPRTVIAVLLVGACLAVILAVRILDTGPPVECAPVPSITTDDCHRAVDLARPFLSAEWGNAGRVTVHTGPCSRAMKCPPALHEDPGFLTVELTSASRFVVIDRRQAVWTAACRMMVYSGDIGSVQPCGS